MSKEGLLKPLVCWAKNCADILTTPDHVYALSHSKEDEILKSAITKIHRRGSKEINTLHDFSIHKALAHFCHKISDKYYLPDLFT